MQPALLNTLLGLRPLRVRALVWGASLLASAALLALARAVAPELAPAAALLPVACAGLLLGPWAGLGAGALGVGGHLALFRSAAQGTTDLWHTPAFLVLAGGVSGVIGWLLWQLVDSLAQHERTGQALRESERLYRAVTERATDGIVIVQDGVIRFCNQRLADMLGLPLPGVLNQPFERFLVPEDRPLLLARYQKRMAGLDVPARYGATLLQPDGGEVAVELNADRMTYRGRLAVLALVRDMHEHRLAMRALQDSEQQLRNLLQQLPIDFWAKDPSGVYIAQDSMNRALFGDMVGKTLDDNSVLDPETRAAWEAEDARVLAGETIHSEYTLPLPDGRERIYQQVVSPVRVGGQAAAIMGIMYDVTELRHMEASLRESNAALTEALNQVRALEGMLPICAHCKKIRDDQGYWHQVEVYVSEHSEVRFSHGLCPDCIAKYYADLMDPEPDG